MLVFVSGIYDILELTELFDASSPHVITSAIHSDVPFEEQLEIFTPVAPNVIRVILATNACESSVTLPDVNHVICLGTCKQVQYNSKHHQSELVNVWISQASATESHPCHAMYY